MSNPALKENPYYEIDKILAEVEKYMTYDMTLFEDRVVERPWTFKEVPTGETADGYKIVYHEHHEGEVIVEGTNLSARNLGNMDVAIAKLFKMYQRMLEMLLSLSLKTGAIELTNLNGLIANAYAVDFYSFDEGEILIIRGYYKESAGEVWS